VKVKLRAQDDEFYVFAESRDQVAKERSMRRRQMKWAVGPAGEAQHHGAHPPG
jgi:hypothetical protein